MGNCKEKKNRRMREAKVVAFAGKNVDLLVKLKSDLVGLLVKEEKMWQQRSKAHWMKSRDKNQAISTIKPPNDLGEIGSWV